MTTQDVSDFGSDVLLASKETIESNPATKLLCPPLAVAGLSTAALKKGYNGLTALMKKFKYMNKKFPEAMRDLDATFRDRDLASVIPPHFGRVTTRRPGFLNLSVIARVCGRF